MALVEHSSAQRAIQVPTNDAGRLNLAMASTRVQVLAGSLLWIAAASRLGLPQGGSSDHHVQFAVVPIIFNTGAAVLPAILGPLTNFFSVLLSPRALRHFLRRRWRLTSVIAATVSLVALAGVSLSRASASHAPAPASTVQIDWARVAEDLIAQARLHESTDVGAAIVSPHRDLPEPVAIDAADPSARASREAANPTASPGGLTGDGSNGGLKPLWRFAPEGSLFLGRPAVFGRRIYVSANQTDLGGYTGLLASLDIDTGKPIWQVTELGKDALPPFFSSPAVTPDGKYVVIGQGLHQDRNASLLCFEAATGKLLWAVKTPLHIESSPVVVGDLAVVGAGAVEGSDGRAVGDPGYVFAVRISDGQQLWKQAVNDPESSPAVDENGIVYIGSGFNGRAVLALRSNSDEDLQAQQLERVVWRTPLAYPVTAPVTLAGDLVIVGGGNGDMVHSDKNPQGLVVALNRTTGEVVWQTKFEDTILGRIAVRDGVLLCPLRTGELAAVAVMSGNVLWRSRVSGTAPLLAGGALTSERAYVVSSDGYLAAFSVSTGKLLDKIYLNDQAKPGTGLSISSPLLVSNRIFVGSETGGLRAILAPQEVP
jgi:outer membrane protein assembly factor BamB